jgi:ribosome biogenesis GTPase / thiamine phosphate phosphatase
MGINTFGWEKYSKAVGLKSGPLLEVGRIAVENKSNYSVLTDKGERLGVVRGKLLKLKDQNQMPKVGDWVRFEELPDGNKVVIEEILPRATKISRKAAQDEEEQVIAANVDEVFIVQSLPDDFNLRRLERYLVIVRQGGAKPVVVLNKIDLNDDYHEMVAEARAVAQDALVVAVSAKTGAGMEQLKSMIEPGATIAFLGSSGVGKSSLVNAIIGEDQQATQEIRESDGRGRHTTTRREMILLDSGGILIDTPGMRELGIWNENEELGKTFQDIEELALQCRYSDCDHDKSEGCAIKAALDAGDLDPARYQSYLKLKKERDYLASKVDFAKERERKASAKKLTKKANSRIKEKYD